jgi:hypothetical protein
MNSNPCAPSTSVGGQAPAGLPLSTFNCQRTAEPVTTPRRLSNVRLYRDNLGSGQGERGYTHHTRTPPPTVQQLSTILPSPADTMSKASKAKTTYTDMDVIYGRGNHLKVFPGNLHYRSLVQALKPFYVSFAMSQKRIVSKLVYNAIVTQEPPGRFLSEASDGECVELTMDEAIRKISQCFRENQSAMKAATSPDNINHKLNEHDLSDKICEMTVRTTQ